MMLPLCTSVTLRRRWATAYSIAARINRLDPSSETGLIPMALLPGNRIEVAPSSSCRKATSLRASRRVLDPGVDVLGILPEDDHVHGTRVLDGRRHALEPAHRPHAGIEVELLAERDVEGADPPAHRGGEGSLDRDEVLADGGDRVLGEPVAGEDLGLFSREDLEPGDPPDGAVGPLDRGVEDPDRRAPDVRAGAVAFDERDDRVIRNAEPALLQGDRLAFGGGRRPGYRSGRRGGQGVKDNRARGCRPAYTGLYTASHAARPATSGRATRS